MAKLFNYYSLDECPNSDKLFEKLDHLMDEGKINYELKEKDVFYIEDLELADDEINRLCREFDDLEVYPYPDYEDYSMSDSDIDDDYYEEDNNFEY